MRILVAVVISTAGLAVSGSSTYRAATSYSEIVGKKIKDALGGDYKNYDVVSYPTDNFGLGTMYAGPSKTVKDEDYVCATFSCLGVSSRADMSLEGFADVGDNGPSVNLTQEEKQQVGLGGVLPILFKVIGIDFSANQNKVSITDLSIGQALPRKLLRPRFNAYMSSPGTEKLLRDDFNQGKLTVIVGDVVLKSLSVDIKTTGDLTAKLDASVSAGVSRTPLLGVSLSKSGEGEFKLVAVNPVVVLRLPKRQPAAGTSAAPGPNSWDDWDLAKLPAQLPASERRTVRN
jgi:hypothetical protein